ncbi:MAG TPA: glutamine-hydrolyzing GMP synthase [Candidatus Peribacteria bacterium]|nr:glutamine-hydrolyzing GMP synthase [Candidatus Peribacteria bacterium]
MKHPRSIVVLDFGGQYAHLIASRVRRFGFYSEIRPPETPASELAKAAGIILSGGPQSVYDKGSPQADPNIFDLGIPVLGLCYGLHWIAQTLGGKVSSGHVKEYGKTPIHIIGKQSQLFKGINGDCTVWMSHGDEASELPRGFSRIATSETCQNAAFSDEARRIFALQFHPEVTHSENGLVMLRNFVDLCEAAPWSMQGYASLVGDEIKRDVGDRKVFMLVSGGVDSTVAFVLLNQVLGRHRVEGLLVDTGLMRKDEVKLIQDAFTKLKIDNLHAVDASEEFFAKLKGVNDPERKRKAIGDTFLDVQKQVGDSMNISVSDKWMLGQGTIYPDTIETGGTKHSDHIKTHHNRVKAVQDMIDAGLVIEPLKDLYKDEVRMLGEELGLPKELVWRHPFPGPGLGVRILCGEAAAPTEEAVLSVDLPHLVLPVRSVGVQGDGRTYRLAVAMFNSKPYTVTDELIDLATTIPNTHRTLNRVLLCTSHTKPFTPVFTPGYVDRVRADLLREADAIVTEEIQEPALYDAIWQFPVVLLPVGTKKGGQSIVLRPISSHDAMTANAVALPEAVLKRITQRILKLEGIDAVFLDLTSKPPGTIEWE